MPTHKHEKYLNIEKVSVAKDTQENKGQTGMAI